MKDLIILGTGVHAKEMAEIGERVNLEVDTWNLLGFVADGPQGAQAFGRAHHGLPLLGTPEVLDAYPAALVVPDNLWPRSCPVAPERLASLVDPTVAVSRTATIGRGCVIFPHCSIGFQSRLGDCVFCLSGSVINHDNVIDDRVIITSNVSLAGFVHVESDCYLGQACTVRQHVTIGRGSQIGMGCVVLKDVPPHSVMVGNPARQLTGRPRVKPEANVKFDR